jgi:hypothetical protein
MTLFKVDILRLSTIQTSQEDHLDIVFLSDIVFQG